MEPITVLTALGLLGTGVAGVWRIAGSIGEFKGKVVNSLNNVENSLGLIRTRLDDHDHRLRENESAIHQIKGSL